MPEWSAANQKVLPVGLTMAVEFVPIVQYCSRGRIRGQHKKIQIYESDTQMGRRNFAAWRHARIHFLFHHGWQRGCRRD